MMILVTGGASSGKSAYAEQVACALPAPHFYLAAMKPFGEEGARRIARHRALRAGKNVISEKPVTMNSRELNEVIAVAEETGKLFTVHQNRRWDCDYLMMKEAYHRPDFGKIFCVE